MESKIKGWGMKLKVTGKQPNSKMCFVCGTENGYGLKSRFYELEDGETMAIFQPEKEHQGYPGRLHGGIAAAILDETIGRAIMSAYSDSIWGVTIEFSMRLKKPVPLQGEIRVLGRIEKDGKRFFEGSGEIVLEDGSTAITAKGKYLKMPIGKIAEMDVEGDEWRVIREKDDPEVIEFFRAETDNDRETP
jgi:acyl-coenzyme A thioesterase PaaI-like protein